MGRDEKKVILEKENSIKVGRWGWHRTDSPSFLYFSSIHLLLSQSIIITYHTHIVESSSLIKTSISGVKEAEKSSKREYLQFFGTHCKIFDYTCLLEKS